MVNLSHFRKKITLVTSTITIGIVSTSLVSKWGFQGHRTINRMAVFSLPKEIFTFYKSNLEYITNESTKPDSRRYVDKKEGAGHFIDLEFYDNDSLLNKRWNDIKIMIPEDSLYKHGILPWRIIQFKYLLQHAFEEKDYEEILKYSAELGHYLADAHVPLHTTKNYNGQFTNQKGIHALWETLIVKEILNDIPFFSGKAEYIPNIQTQIKQIILESHSCVSTVLEEEKRLTNEEKIIKYKFEKSNLNHVNYSSEFIRAYDKRLNGMVTKRMLSSIRTISSFWYTAWVDAGQPKLENKTIKHSTTDLENNNEECTH